MIYFSQRRPLQSVWVLWDVDSKRVYWRRIKGRESRRRWVEPLDCNSGLTPMKGEKKGRLGIGWKEPQNIVKLKESLGQAKVPWRRLLLRGAWHQAEMVGLWNLSCAQFLAGTTRGKQGLGNDVPGGLKVLQLKTVRPLDTCSSFSAR